MHNSGFVKSDVLPQVMLLESASVSAKGYKFDMIKDLGVWISAERSSSRGSLEANNSRLH